LPLAGEKCDLCTESAGVKDSANALRTKYFGTKENVVEISAVKAKSSERRSAVYQTAAASQIAAYL
jgi:hypothetical protein